jgi:hypothetical protein
VCPSSVVAHQGFCEIDGNARTNDKRTHILFLPVGSLRHILVK